MSEEALRLALTECADAMEICRYMKPEEWPNAWAAVIAQARAALSEGQAPEPQTVPREPSEEMMAAAAGLPGVRAANDVLSLHQVRTGTVITELEGPPLTALIWRAMYDAASVQQAPEPVAQEPVYCGGRLYDRCPHCSAGMDAARAKAIEEIVRDMWIDGEVSDDRLAIPYAHFDRLRSLSGVSEYELESPYDLPLATKGAGS